MDIYISAPTLQADIQGDHCQVHKMFLMEIKNMKSDTVYTTAVNVSDTGYSKVNDISFGAS